MSEQPADNTCEHFYVYCSPAGYAGGVEICTFCHMPNPDDLRNFVAEVLRDAARAWQLHLIWPFGATTWLRRRANRIERDLPVANPRRQA